MVKSYKEINQDAIGRTNAAKWHEKYRKAILFALIALILALLAFYQAQSAQDTADINNVFNIVVNNTDLGTNGTHERVHDVTYYANSSPIAVLVSFHVVGTGAPLSVDSNFSINKTVVLDRDYSTSAGANIHEHFSYYVIVPKGANYSVTNSTNIFSTEWREYPILSGKNGTLSINQTVLADLSSVNASLDYLNDSKVNKSGDIMTGLLNASYGINTTMINVTQPVYFHYYNTSDTPTLAATTLTKVKFVVKESDTYNNFNGTSFITPIDGHYFFAFGLYFTNSADALFRADLVVNGATYKIVKLEQMVNNNLILTASVVTPLKKGDVVEVFIYSYSSSTAYVLGGSQFYWFEGYKLG